MQLKKLLGYTLGLAFVCVWSTTAHAQINKVLSKVNGGVKPTTPQPIKSIAPNGISIGGKKDSGSSLAVIIGPYINASNGGVYYGTNSGNVSRIATAQLTYTSSGQAYWVYKNQRVRAPQHDRKVNTLAEQQQKQQQLEMRRQQEQLKKQQAQLQAQRQQMLAQQQQWEAQQRQQQQLLQQQQLQEQFQQRPGLVILGTILQELQNQ